MSCCELRKNRANRRCGSELLLARDPINILDVGALGSHTGARDQGAVISDSFVR